MPFQIISASGVQYGALVDDQGRLSTSASVTAGSTQYIAAGSVIVTGSVQTYGTSVSTGSEVYIKAGSIQTYNPIGTGSMVVSGGVVGSMAITTNPVPISGALGNVAGSFALTTGSILTYGTAAGYAGSDVTVVAGSIQTYSPLGVGSTRIAEQGVNLQVWNSGLFSMVGSITSMPSISASNESIAKDTGIHTGSATLVGGQFNGSMAAIRMDTGSFLMIAGSISSMPSISATSPSVYAASGIIANTGSVYLV